MKLVHLSFTLLLASLLTGGKGDCYTDFINEANECATTLTVDEQQACVTCLENAQVPATVVYCGELESAVCSAVLSCESICGNCNDEILRFFDCNVNVNSNCDLTCASTGSGGTGAELGSLFTISFLGLASLLWV